MIVLLSMVAIVCGLTCAMVIVAKRNERERKRKAIVWYKERQRASRIMKWKYLAKEWKEEQKKPVKVQFT
jgi:hypothetical protein